MISITTFTYNRCPGIVAVQVSDTKWHIFVKTEKVHVAIVTKDSIVVGLVNVIAEEEYAKLRHFITVLQTIL